MTPDRIVEITERHILDDMGRPITVHEWMLEEMYRPLGGFRACAAGEQLCARCRRDEGVIFDSFTEATKKPHPKCDGLHGEKIRVVVIKAKRQQGKTTGAACYHLAHLAEDDAWRGVYMGASEDQGGRTFGEKFLSPVQQSAALSKRIEPHGTGLRNVKRRSSMRYIPASPKASVGATTRHVTVDEARDLGPKAVVRILPTVIAADVCTCKGERCEHATSPKDVTGPWGDAYRAMDVAETREARAAACFALVDLAMPTCPSCGGELELKHGTVLLMSNAGDEDGGWWHELCTTLAEACDRAWHYYDMGAETKNTRTSEQAMGAISRVLGQMQTTGHLVQQEVKNTFTREGDELIPEPALRAHLGLVEEQHESAMRCVAFMDPARKIDLCSLVVCGDPESEDGTTSAAPLFENLDCLRIAVWDPKTSGGRVDFGKVYRETVEILSRFRLIRMWIDLTDRYTHADLEQLWEQLRATPALRGRIEPYRADALGNLELWDALEARMLGPPARLRLFRHQRMEREFRVLKLARSPGRKTMKVVDGSNRHSKGRMHRDVTLSLAGCCHGADMLRLRAGRDPTEAMERMNRRLLGRARPRDTWGEDDDVPKSVHEEIAALRDTEF